MKGVVGDITAQNKNMCQSQYQMAELWYKSRFGLILQNGATCSSVRWSNQKTSGLSYSWSKTASIVKDKITANHIGEQNQ